MVDLWRDREEHSKSAEDQVIISEEDAEETHEYENDNKMTEDEVYLLT